MSSDISYFKSICRLSRAFGKLQSKIKLLELIVQSAMDTMNGKAACIFIRDEEKGIFIPAAQQGLPKDYPHQNPEHAARLTEELFEKGFLAIKDAVNDQRSEHHGVKAAAGIASILSVPVRDNERIVGVLALYTDRKRDFSEDEIRFLQALAEQGGMALERARLIGQIRNNAKIFHKLSTSINSSLEISEVMQKLTTGVADSLKAKAVSVSFIDETSGELRMIESHGIGEEYAGKGNVIKDEFIENVLDGETIYMEDAREDKRTSQGPQNRKQGFVTIIAAPIKTARGIIGVLQLNYGFKRKFFDDEIQMINTLAQQAGTAAQNATCYLTLEKEMDDLKNDMWCNRSWF